MGNETRTILLVEDQALIAMAEKRRLEQGGYSVRHVLTGEEAVRVVVEGAAPVDLVLMDINLGDGIDGTEAARRILAHTEIPVVFLSSHTEPEVVEKTEKITSYGYVVKNSGITVLDASIKMALKLFDARMERGRAEGALRESETTQRMMLKTIEAGIIVVNPDNHVIEFANSTAARMFGAAVEDIVGRVCHQFLCPADVGICPIVDEGKTLDNTERIMVRSDGTHLPVIKSVKAIELWGKTRLIETFIDISDRKRAEESLLNTQANMTAIIENTLDNIWSINRDYEIVHINQVFTQAFYAVFGVMLKPGVNIYRSLPPALQPAWKERYDRALRGERFVFLDEIEAFGNQIHIEVAVNPIIEQGKVIGASFFGRDITARKQTEDRFLNARATLAAIVENSNDNIWSINANHEITYINHVFVEAYKAAFGVELKEGSSVLEGLPAAILPVWKERYTRVLNGERLVVVDSVSLRGVETHVEVAMNPIVHGERIIGASMTGRDISERVREDERIRASERRAASQRSALAKLALDQVFAGENTTRALQRVVEVIAQALSVARTSVWVLSEDGTCLQCLALYRADTGNHSKGPVLKAADLPRYFHAIISENRIYAEDAQNDPRTSELTESYLRPSRITSMLDAGVFREGRLVGVVCSEHIGPKRRWQPDEESFLSTAAAITAQIFINIERTKAEEALKKSERKYRGLSTLLRLLADTMPDMLWAKNLDKEYMFVNKAICVNLLNASDTEEPLGKTDMFFAVRERESHPENPEWHTFGEVCRDSDAITLEEMRPMQFEEFGNVKGKNMVLEVHKAPFFDEEGKLIGVVGSARDVTAAKETETQLRKLSRAVEQSPASVVITDLDGAIEYANPKFTEITGYTLEEAKGQNPRVLKSGEQPPEYYKELWQTISSGKTWRGEFHNKKKNGELFWEAASISPILTSEGMTTSFIAVKEDITERKRAEEALARQLAEKETLLREVHHRVKNNISSIKGLLSLQAGEAESAETRAALEDALARVQSMGELYDRLLLTGEYREVGMKDYLEGLVGSILESFPEGAKPALDIRIDDFAMSPKNAASVGIILNELVTNTLKYAFKGREGGALTISLDRDGPSAALAVKDDGVGLPADFRLPDGADPSERTGAGHGFGLTLVQMLAEQLGGTLSAGSGESGGGAVFSFRFPLDKDAAERS